ncbi:caspase family protein, partial [Cupriavidus sp. UYPR2.512]|uniref:caspase family protein n=1 Tax=Cupriavidus sp. UYPR2.512 TaxID=1080187 RepID=UPI0018DF0035
MSKKALIVGIDDYDPPNQLPSCVKDAGAFENLVKNQYHFDDVRLLTDKKAIKSNLISNLEWLVSGATKNDRLVLFYSGHGYSPVVDKVTREALVAQDGEFFFDGDLAKIIKDLPDGILTIVIDACFSGGMEKPWLDKNGNVQMIRVKCWQPSGKDYKDKPNGYAPFGNLKALSGDDLTLNFSSKRLIASQSGGGSDFQKTKLQNPNSKGLLLSACLADEEAAASRPSTEGLSAFTFSLLDSINVLGRNGTTEEIIEAAGNALHKQGIKQTPMLKEPMAPPNLGEASFIMLVHPEERDSATKKTPDTKPDKVASASEPAAPQPADGQNINETSQKPLKRGTQEDIADIVNAVLPYILIQSQGDNMKISSLNSGFDKGWIEDVTRTVSTVVPVILSALQSKCYQAQQPATPADKGWFDDVTHIASIAVPVVLSALQSKGYQAQQPATAGDKGWFEDVTHIASIAVPVVLSALQSKGYQAQQPATAGDKGWFEDVTHIASIVAPVVLSALQSKG